MIIASDVDDVVLELIQTWLSLYNLEFEDNLNPEDITDWNVSLFVKPEAKEKIYDYIKYPDIFWGSKPVEGALENINKLKSMGNRVIYVTVNNPENVKFEWLKYHGFLESGNDLVITHDKSLINAHYLFDDKYENALSFPGYGVLKTSPWNKKYFYPKKRANNWDEFLKIFQGFEG